MNSLMVVERELDKDHMPVLANILLQTPALPALAFKSAFMDCLRKSQMLESCTRISLFNCAASFAFFGLLPGGATGQAFMLPFRDNKKNVVNAVPVIGYKGYNTIAGRSALIIEGTCVRKDDDFKPTLGSKPNIHHIPNIAKSDSQIIGAWSLLAKGEYRYSPVVMGIQQLMAIKAKSMGARKDDSPWNDKAGPGFEAMCEKSVRRRQARAIPLNAFVMADAMETTHDLGRPAWIVPSERDGSPALLTPEGITKPPPPEEATVTLPPKNLKIEAVVGEIKGKPKMQSCKDINEWKRVMLAMVVKTPPKFLIHVRRGNGAIFLKLTEAGFGEEVRTVTDAINEREG